MAEIDYNPKGITRNYFMTISMEEVATLLPILEREVTHADGLYKGLTHKCGLGEASPRDQLARETAKAQVEILTDILKVARELISQPMYYNI